MAAEQDENDSDSSTPLISFGMFRSDPDVLYHYAKLCIQDTWHEMQRHLKPANELKLQKAIIKERMDTIEYVFGYSIGELIPYKLNDISWNRYKLLFIGYYRQQCQVFNSYFIKNDIDQLIGFYFPIFDEQFFKSLQASNQFDLDISIKLGEYDGIQDSDHRKNLIDKKRSDLECKLEELLNYTNKLWDKHFIISCSMDIMQQIFGCSFHKLIPFKLNDDGLRKYSALFDGYYREIYNNKDENIFVMIPKDINQLISWYYPIFDPDGDELKVIQTESEHIYPIVWHILC